MSTNYGPLATAPSGIVQATTETIPWGIDMTNAISGISGGSVASPTVTLTDQSNDKAITLADAPSVSGNIVTQIIRGSALTANHTYLLAASITAKAGSPATVISTVTTLTCPI